MQYPGTYWYCTIQAAYQLALSAAPEHPGPVFRSDSEEP